MSDNSLKLENQLCFRFYAATRLIVKAYQPHLDKLGLTYPQYLVMLVLWEYNTVPVKAIAKHLMLETNTLTPLLKRMEKNGLIERNRSKTDERSVNIHITEKGLVLKNEAQEIPQKMLELYQNSEIEMGDLTSLYQALNKMIEVLKPSNA